MKTTLFALALCTFIAFCTPLHAATLFGLVNTGEIYTSNDGGVTWSILAGIGVPDAVSIAAAKSSSELFLGSESGLVYRSTDGGSNWTAMGAVSATDVVELMPIPTGEILALTRSGLLWESTDNGATFSSLFAFTASNFVSMAWDTAGTLYAATTTGEISRSTNYGSSWSTVGAITVSDAVEIRTIGVDLYVMTSTGTIYKSTDMGVNWTAVGTVSQVNMSGMTLDLGDLVVVSKEGLVASSSDGMSWDWKGSINQLVVMSIGNDDPTRTGIGSQPPAIDALRFDSIWPNPGHGGDELTRVRFGLGQPAQVTIELYDVSGRLVATRAPQAFGISDGHEIQWAVGDLPSGVYFIQLITNSGLRARSKLTLVR